MQENNAFEEFWKVFPRRSDKVRARSFFIRALKIASEEEIIQGAFAYAKHIRDERISIQYVKLPTTWLENECWTDEYELNLPEEQEKKPTWVRRAESWKKGYWPTSGTWGPRPNESDFECPQKFKYLFENDGKNNVVPFQRSLFG